MSVLLYFENPSYLCTDKSNIPSNNHEFTSSEPKKSHNNTHAYGHVQVRKW
jgi:hypothetical protein